MSRSSSLDSPEGQSGASGEATEGPDEDDLEADESWQPRLWDSKYILKFATAVVQRPLLLQKYIYTPEHAAARRAALEWVASALSPPKCCVETVRKRLGTFKKLFLKKMGVCARLGAKRHVPATQLAPRWARLVEPLLRDWAELKRVYKEASVEAVSKPSPSARAVTSPSDEVERVMTLLTSRARALRTLDARSVARRLPDMPHVQQHTLLNIWQTMLSVVSQKLELLVASGDSAAGQGAAARLSRCEWALCDVMLLHSGRVLVRPDSGRQLQPLQALVAAFHMAQLYRLEEAGAGGGGGGAAAWRGALAAHRRRGRIGSAVLLQRRWHELKLCARAALAAAAKHPTLTVQPLHAAIARRYPHVVTRPLPSWQELVAAGGVYEDISEGEGSGEEARCVTPDAEHLAGLESTWDRDGGYNSSDDDLILVEREIETIDLDLDLDAEEQLQPGVTGHKRHKHPPSDTEAQDYMSPLQARRRGMAQALEAELDRQLRELDPPASGGAPRRSPRLYPATSRLPPLAPKEEPLIMFDSSDDSGPDSRRASGHHARGVKQEPAGGGGEALEEGDTSSRGDSAEEDEEASFDPKLLMRTSVPLTRVDSAGGWRRLAAGAGGSARVSCLGAALEAPKRRRIECAMQAAKDLITELLKGDDELRSEDVKCESEGDGDTECEPGETETESGRVRKRVKLPDIAEVRRINQGMLTAQVAPLANVTTVTTPVTTPETTPVTTHVTTEQKALAAALDWRRNSDDAEPLLYIDESAGAGGGQGEGESLTAGELRAVLRRVRSEMTRAETGVGVGAGAGTGGAAAGYCCVARRHHAVNTARYRNAERALRHPPPEVPLHSQRCGAERKGSGGGSACACCCAYLLGGGETRALQEALQRLRDDVHAALHSQNDSEKNTKDTKKPTAPLNKSSNKKRPVIKRKKYTYKPEPEAPPEADPAAEWIRQKNLTSRFFDLNLKQPPPTPKVKPKQTPSAPPELQTSQVPHTPQTRPVPQLVPFPSRPKTPVTNKPPNLLPIATVSAPSRLPTPTHSRLSTPIPSSVAPPLHTPVSNPKDPTVSPLARVTTTTQTKKVTISLLKKPNAPPAPAPQTLGGDTLQQPVMLAGGELLPANAIPITLLPVQNGNSFRLVPVQFAPVPAPAPAPVPAPAPAPAHLVSNVLSPPPVIDLCDDDEDDPHPPAAPHIASKTREILSSLPPGITVKSKSDSAALPVTPQVASGPPPGQCVLLNDHIAKQPSPHTLEVSPLENGKHNIKVFQICKNGRLRRSRTDLPRNDNLAARPPLLSPSACGAPAGSPGALNTNKISKIVIVPRGGSGGTPPRPALRLTRAPPGAPTSADRPRILNEMLAESAAAAGAPGAAGPSAPNAALKIEEIRTTDGRRVLVMRRSGSAPTSGKGAPRGGPPGEAPSVPPTVTATRPAYEDTAAVLTKIPQGQIVLNKQGNKVQLTKSPTEANKKPDSPPTAAVAKPSNSDGFLVISNVSSMSAEAPGEPAPYGGAPGGDQPERSYPEASTLFPDVSVEVGLWASKRDHGKLLVQCLDLASTYYSVSGVGGGGGGDTYYVVSSRSLPFSRPSVWPTRVPAAHCVRLQLPTELHPLAGVTTALNRTYTMLSRDPLLYGRIVFVVRSARELREAAAGGAALQAVSARRGTWAPLTFKRTDGLVDVNCTHRHVAQKIMEDINAVKISRPEKPVRVDVPRIIPQKFGNFVKIAPKPVGYVPQAPPTEPAKLTVGGKVVAFKKDDQKLSKSKENTTKLDEETKGKGEVAEETKGKGEVAEEKDVDVTGDFDMDSGSGLSDDDKEGASVQVREGQVDVCERSASEEEIAAPRPSRRAARDARAKLNDLINNEEARPGGEWGEGGERQVEYAEAHGGDMDDDEDYDAAGDTHDYTRDNADDMLA